METSAKKTYRRPAVVTREKLETVAGLCAKTGGNAACTKTGPVSS